MRGRLLFDEPMMFKRLFASGDSICEKGVWYTVRSVDVRGDTQIVYIEAQPGG
jgi:hypothetical protein